MALGKKVAIFDWEWGRISASRKCPEYLPIFECNGIDNESVHLISMLLILSGPPGTLSFMILAAAKMLSTICSSVIRSWPTVPILETKKHTIKPLL